MKKLFVAATLGLALVSCGGPSLCDCKQMFKESAKEFSEAKDEDAIKALTEKYAEQEKECKKLEESVSEKEEEAQLAECK